MGEQIGRERLGGGCAVGARVRSSGRVCAMLPLGAYNRALWLS